MLVRMPFQTFTAFWSRPSSSSLLFHLATWPVWSSKNVKTISIRTMLIILFRNWSKTIFPHSTVTWFHINTNQAEDILIKSLLRVVYTFTSPMGSKEQLFIGNTSSVSNSCESKLYCCTTPIIGRHLLVFLYGF